MIEKPFAPGSTNIGAARSSDREIPSGLIDFHHHIRPPGVPDVIMQLMSRWSPEGAVAEMDRAGVRVGMAFPVPVFGPDPMARQALARRWNDYGADLGARFPGRFGLFASLPLLDTDACLAEIEYAVGSLHADGFGIATNYDDMWLGDERLWPVYEVLNALNAIVFVHPRDAPCCAPDKLSYHRDVMDGSWLEWPMNTARTIFSLMISGTLRRFPRIRIIFSHGGGVMPLLVSRIEGFRGWPHVGEEGLGRLFPNGLRSELGRLHFECAQAYSTTNIDALRSIVPDTQLLFGSDFPIFPLAHAATQFADLPLDKVLQTQIAHGNAGKLLPRWSSEL
jgi:predicted TIM-barrel fold metal-dependent hydrolase